MRKKKYIENRLYNVRIKTGIGTIEARALYDSGNLLNDPFYNKPVSIIDRKLMPAIPADMYVPMKVHYIPFCSVGEKHGSIMVIIADSVEIRQIIPDVRADSGHFDKGILAKKRVGGDAQIVLENVPLALSTTELSCKNDFQMLLNAEMR